MREVDVSLDLLPRHHEVMRCLGLLTRALDPELWCVVGGLMVLVVAREAGRADSRGEGTKDGDIVVDVVTEPDVLPRATRALIHLGYSLPADDPGPAFARCTFTSGNAQVDVLAPDDAPADALEAAGDVRTIAIPGGRRALAGSELVRLYYAEDAHDVEVRVPTLTTAILVKAAAAVDPRTAGHPRHIQDTAYLLACIDDPRAARTELDARGRDLLRDLLTGRLVDRADAAWAHLNAEDHDRAIAAVEYMTR